MLVSLTSEICQLFYGFFDYTKMYIWTGNKYFAMTSFKKVFCFSVIQNIFTCTQNWGEISNKTRKVRLFAVSATKIFLSLRKVMKNDISEMCECVCRCNLLFSSLPSAYTTFAVYLSISIRISHNEQNIDAKNTNIWIFEIQPLSMNERTNDTYQCPYYGMNVKWLFWINSWSTPLDIFFREG